VGAKLYYPNDTIQHAGTILGLGGGADHAFRNFGRTDPGYCNRLTLTQNLSAVTAACMVLRRRVYNEVGGLDEVNLPVAFNDVDLCLRIREHGYRVVWTPFAELYHHESISRGSDYAPEKIDRFMREIAYLKRRWASVIAHDPYYNPNLTVERCDFTLAFPPRVPLPWESVAAGLRQSNIEEAEIATSGPAQAPG
jgi:O-antigen biosynthesis protein